MINPDKTQEPAFKCVQDDYFICYPCALKTLDIPKKLRDKVNFDFRASASD